MKNAQEKCFVEENDDFQLEEIAPCTPYNVRRTVCSERREEKKIYSQHHRLMCSTVFALCAFAFDLTLRNENSYSDVSEFVYFIVCIELLFFPLYIGNRITLHINTLDVWTFVPRRQQIIAHIVYLRAHAHSDTRTYQKQWGSFPNVMREWNLNTEYTHQENTAHNGTSARARRWKRIVFVW